MKTQDFEKVRTILRPRGFIRRALVVAVVVGSSTVSYVPSVSAAAPSNDSWYTRTSVNDDSVGTTGSTVEATTEAGREAKPNAGYPSTPKAVWYEFPSYDSSSNLYESCTITVTGHAGFIPLLQVAGRTGTANSLSGTPEGPYFDDASGDSSTAQVTYVFPTPQYSAEYSIAVSAFDAGSGGVDGTFTLDLSCTLVDSGDGDGDGGYPTHIDIGNYVNEQALPNTR